MTRIKKSGIVSFYIGVLVLLIALAFVFTREGISDAFPQMVSVWVIWTGSVLVLIGLKSAVSNNIHSFVLYLAYLMRVACMFIDIYGRKYITLLHSGGDSETFYNDSITLYYKLQHSGFGTKYPYVINAFFHILGDNRICVQYINIIFWVLSCFILIRFCYFFQVKDKTSVLIYILWGFLPTGILLSSILLRESMEMFFGLWSFECFVYWMKCGRKKYFLAAFFCVVPAVILHSASVALWVTYAVVAMFWDYERQMYRWKLKSIIILAGFIFFVVLIFCTPLRNWFFIYFGNDFSLYGITHRPYVIGGSDYLVNMDCQSWIQFVPYTLLRMFYFLFSPLPTEARGISDIMMFLADGCLLFFILLFMVNKILKKNMSWRYIFTSLIAVVMFAGIFAWGCRNAGTALRHRYLVWSIVAAGVCVSCGRGTEGES